MTISAAAAPTAPPTPVHTSSQVYRAVAAASIGNALEWFDLTVYGYFAVIISRLFFPTGDQTVSLLLALGTFGVSYLMRPLGAIVLGAYADRVGRKASLMLSIVLMMLGTLLMAVMPTYASIGILAPLGVFAARLMQGFSAGGEFGASTAFMVEHGPDRKGFLASWQFASQGLSSVLASAFGVALSSGLSPEQLQSWGWRIPFFFGLLIGPVGFYIRRHVDETPEFAHAEPTHTPLRDVFGHQKMRVLLAVGAVAMSTGANYLILYMPTYAIKELGLPQSTGFAASLVAAIMLTVVAPFVGHWSDRIGRTPIMIGVAALFLVSVYSVFAALIAHASLVAIVLALAWIGGLKASYSGALPALMSEIFPVQTRSTGMNLSYNVGVTLFGGFAPFIITSLIAITGSNLAPSFYLMFTALVSLASLFVVRNRLRLH